MVIFLIIGIVFVAAVGTSSDTHDATAAAGAVGGVSLAIVVMFGIFLGLNIWFLKVINQYRSFLTVRFFNFEKANIFSCTLIGTRESAWPTLGRPSTSYLYRHHNDDYALSTTDGQSKLPGGACLPATDDQSATTACI